MRIGYACITVGVPGTAQRTTIAKYATEDKLLELIGHNLDVLDRILDYNLAHDIRLFRISSDIIPFGSSPVNTLDWPNIFAKQLAAIGAKAQANGVRLSMHPGQYTVINSPNADVVARAVEDLRYHDTLLTAMGMDGSNKLILHIGGVYGDKPAAVRRFKDNWKTLDESIRARLVIENDDKLFTVGDVLAIGRECGIPVVYDNLHNAVNPSTEQKTEAEWIAAAGETWGGTHGPQKMHYSQQAVGKKPGGHSRTVYIDPFLQFCDTLPQKDIDVMLEVKDKNLSAVKCVNCVTAPHKINRLEAEWALYKYSVLEHAPSVYNAIRGLLKDKSAYPAAEFYQLLEEAEDTPPTPGNVVNAAQHVWGYFKDKATPAQAASFAGQLAAYKADTGSEGRLKASLKRLATQYGAEYLLHSYYFL